VPQPRRGSPIRKDKLISSNLPDLVAAELRRQSDNYPTYFELASSLLIAPEGSPERMVIREQLIQSLAEKERNSLLPT